MTLDKGRLATLLAETGAFRDLDRPVILHSGKLGIYFVNTEKLLGDPDIDKRLEEFKDSPQNMIDYAFRIRDKNPGFDEVIDSIAVKTMHIAAMRGYKELAISGGQRRDWLFSGPVARVLNVPHISLFKAGGRADVNEDGKFATEADYLGHDMFDGVIHVVDLLTEGSSCYREDDGRPAGWIPMLRERGAKIKDLVTVVTRLQEGEKNLAEQGVDVHPFVSIDEDFLREHSRFPERAVSYFKDPSGFCRDYLEQNGALEFVDAFGPDRKDDRGMEFVNQYGNHLQRVGKWDEFVSAVEGRYGVNIGK